MRVKVILFLVLWSLVMASAANLPRRSQLARAKDIDKRFFDTIYAEVGGGVPEEVAAVASAFLNQIGRRGYERALNRSSAYKLGSKEYQKAQLGKLNPYEQKIYERNKLIVQDLLTNPDKVLPYTNFENVRAYGTPSWASSAVGAPADIGRQRFYILND